MSASNKTFLGTAVAAAVAAAALAAACKGDTEIKIDPQTKNDLDQCNKDKADKDKAIQTLRDEAAKAALGSGSGGEIVVTFENDILKIKSNMASSGTGPTPIDNKVAAAASTAFENLVQKSRGAIQKCYEQALKKNTSIQARTITLRVGASFTADGKLAHANFDPQIDPTFDNCMQAVAAKWVMPQNSPAMTFRAPVSLTPS